MKLRAFVAGAVAASCLFVAPVAMASDNVQDEKSEVAESGYSPEIQKWADSVGTEFLENSEALGKLNTWIYERNGAHDVGYVTSVNDPESGSTKIYWNGDGDSEEQRLFLSQAAELGVAAEIVPFPYSYAAVQESLQAVTGQSEEFTAQGFELDMVAALSLDDMESVIVRGHYVDGAKSSAARSAATSTVDAIAEAAPGVLPVKIEVNETPSQNYVSRVADAAPFWAGGLMKTAGGSVCSTGFSVNINGTTRATTARHCLGTFGAFAGSASYGASYAPNQYGGRLLSASGGGKVFDGSPFATSNPGVPVRGFQDLNVGDLVCTQGGSYGPRCDIRVQSINLTFNDTYGTFGALWGVQINGNIASGGGDSGGPVITLGGGGFLAAGMIQGAAGSRYLPASTCQAASRMGSTRCSYDVVFTSMRSVADVWGASLVTS